MHKKIIPRLNLSIFPESQINQNTTLSSNTDFFVITEVCKFVSITDFLL